MSPDANDLEVHGQDDGPPDFILHVQSRGVINVQYCTYCTSE